MKLKNLPKSQNQLVAEPRHVSFHKSDFFGFSDFNCVFSIPYKSVDLILDHEKTAEFISA